MERIRALLSKELEELEKNINSILGNNNELFCEINDFVFGKSKRIRSVLTLLYLKNHDISISKDTILLLSAGELIHNASLMHDDVIDNSDIRRGNKTLFKKYGSKISILAGDYLVSKAIKELISYDDVILNIFLNAVSQMSEAEIYQFSKRDKNITVDEYIKIAEGKTASLFEAILESSAILHNLSREKAKTFGKIFGILFQINNDLQDDSIKNDNQNGVKTLLNILGIEKTQILKDNYKEEMRNLLADFKENKYKTAIEDLVKGL